MSLNRSFKRREPKRAGDLVSRALRDLGVPSKRVSTGLERAWASVADPAWIQRTQLRRIEGGVLQIGVDSAPLREELAQFHQDRLLTVLRTSLPDVPLIGLQFVLDTVDDSTTGRNPE